MSCSYFKCDKGSALDWINDSSVLLRWAENGKQQRETNRSSDSGLCCSYAGHGIELFHVSLQIGAALFMEMHMYYMQQLTGAHRQQMMAAWVFH